LALLTVHAVVVDHIHGRCLPLRKCGIWYVLTHTPPHVYIISIVTRLLTESFYYTALAANGLVRYIFGAVFPLFTIQMYENLDVHWASSVFAFLSLIQLPIPWLLFKFGPKLREKSNF
jgi:energy-converting hydrogenase Eha subunit G